MTNLAIPAQGRCGIHTCAVTQSADAFCWGNNERGQLGNPALSTQTNGYVPVQVIDL